MNNSKAKYSVCLLLLLILTSCRFGEGNEKTKEDPVLQMEITFKDTVKTDLQEGILSYERKLPDTLVIGSEDERFIILYVAYHDISGAINEAKFDTFVDYSKGTIDKKFEINFNVKRDSLRGANYLLGKVVDQTFLHSYSDSTQVRMLEDISDFNLPVYIE